MTQKQILTVFAFLFFTGISKGGDSITNEQLAGTWTIRNVKTTPLESPQPLSLKENCYLCDLYKAGLGLVFTADGKVDYSNYGNPNQVRYTIINNVLTFYAETNTGTDDKVKKETSVQFTASLHNGVLTLVYSGSTTTETYTFTK